MIPDLNIDDLRTDGEAFNLAVRAVLRLPRAEDVPSPGKAASWTHDDWRVWGRENGFPTEERTKHCYAFLHELLPIRLSIASSPSDVRTSMNVAQDIRGMIRNAVISGDHDIRAARKLPEFENDLPKLVTVMRDQFERRALIARLPITTDEATYEMVARLQGVLRRLNEDFNVGARAALRTVCKEESTAENLYIRVRDDLPIGVVEFDIVYPALLDVLEVHRLAEAAEKDAKRAAREARHEKPVVDPDQHRFDTAMSAAKSSVLGSLREAQAKAEQLLNLVKNTSLQLTSTAFPGYPAAQVAELRAALAAKDGEIVRLIKTAEESDVARNIAVAKAGELQSTLDALAAEKAVADQLIDEASVDGRWRVAYLQLVDRLEPCVAKEDLLSVATGFQAVRVALADARALIAKGGQ